MKQLLIAAFLLISTVLAGAQRAVQSLDGDWQIVFDPDNAGREAGWHKQSEFSKLEQKRPIRVPGCWEEVEKDYEGVAFYRRKFTVPADWKNRVVRLQFDAVNFRAEVWVNDVAVGVHEGGFTPFAFRIDDLLKFGGEDSLILRVAGPILLQDKRIDGVGPMETPQWRGAITGGIWQSVRLVATSEVYVEDVFRVEWIESDENTDLAVPVFVSRSRAKGPDEARRFRDLAEFIKAGGTAVYLEGGGPWAPWGVAKSASRLLPVPARSKQAIGTWTCISHVVKKHPIFDGLPVDGSMGAIYGNVWADRTLLDFGGETIVGSIGYDWFPDYDKRKRHYYGPGDTWWGADLAVRKLGKGRLVACQLRIVDHLGKDPVAEKILGNMMRWVAEDDG